MHILFFTPFFNQPRGNATTSKRIIHFLQKLGIHTSVFPYLEKDPWYLPKADVVHILHATRFVSWAKENNYTLDTPYIITMGGTDLNHDLSGSLTDEVYDFLNKAAYITVFTPDALSKVAALNQTWAEKTKIIPQAPWISWNILKQIHYDQPNILLPAGLRPVKDVLHAIPALDQLAGSYPGLQFTILGAILDQQVFEQVLQVSQSRPWMNYAGVVPLEVMTHWYNEANIVLNTSISEGQSLAVMEAMAVGRPVIARRNEANQNLIQHAQTGWLYETMEELEEAVHSIMNNEALRNRVIENAQYSMKKHFSPKKEASAYIQLYKRAGY